MPGQIYLRSKLTSLPDLLTAAFDDFKAAGFVAKLPASGPLTLAAGVGKFVVESTAANNPLNSQQAYRILFETFTSEGEISLRAAIAGLDQISETGEVQDFPYTTQMSGTTTLQYDGSYKIGQLGKKFLPRPYVATGPSATPGLQPGDVFISRGGVRTYNVSSGNTMSYLLSVSDRGVVFYTWMESSDPLPTYSFFAVQVPVNRDDGTPLADMNSPIFVVYDCDNTGLFKYVLNEADTARATPSVVADEDTVNSAGIINSAEQVAVKRGNKYMVTFPNRLNTDRYAYTEELDMIAYSSADVIGEGTDVPVRIYGEAEDRLYRAMKANGANNTGMRLLVLIEGGGIPAAN